MTDEGKIRTYVDNSLRSLFEMIAFIKYPEDECVLIDCDEELSYVLKGGTKDASVCCADDCGGAVCSYKRIRMQLEKNIHPEDREAFLDFTDPASYVKMISEHVHVAMECRIRHAKSRYKWCEIIICNTTLPDSTEGDDCLFLIRDINARKCAEIKREASERAVLKSLQDQYDALFEENMTDEQTGCYNRKGLKYYSDIVIDDAIKNGRDLFVCVADLNGLKHLNDTYGHAAGDEAIAAVSSELKAAAPSGAKLVRIGGDEFLIFASVEKGSKEPDAFDSKVDEGLMAYNSSHDNPYEIGASFGWVLLPPKEGMTSLDEYIEMADEKMYSMRVLRDKYRRE